MITMISGRGDVTGDTAVDVLECSARSGRTRVALLGFTEDELNDEIAHNAFAVGAAQEIKNEEIQDAAVEVLGLGHVRQDGGHGDQGEEEGGTVHVGYCSVVW